jgi:exoribonuclease-2
VHVLYEESGDFKVGTVLEESAASLHVESPHGKRAKVKGNHVLLRFAQPAPGELLARAEDAANAIDTDFLWECCGEPEFDFADLASEYYGHKPEPVEAAAILLKLHSDPLYFHRKGRGRFRAAPPDILKAALAGREKKRQQTEQVEQWAAALGAGTLPEALVPLVPQLLYKPDRARLETKAVELACERTGLSPAKLFEHCGALASSHEYHLGRFLFEHFPHGAALGDDYPVAMPADLPLAQVAAFSLDDATTTEIDDAFSLVRGDDGRMRVGVHIAAPALAFTPGSDVGAIARERLSTVYMPGHKITMLPEAVIAPFSLGEGATRPALSLYFDVDSASGAVLGSETRIEQVHVLANLRHHQVEVLNETFERGGALHAADPDVPFAADLHALWRFALALEAARGKASVNTDRAEYSFYVEDDRVRIMPRKRGAPLDKLVAELMILANRTWGQLLDRAGVPAIYRVQPSGGKVRMSTGAAEHAGLGVSHYAWLTSPLRRYVDLLNQWQLVAALADAAPPFLPGSEELLAALRDFESAYATYAEFQERMERYWCLRWLLQEQVTLAPAVVVREGLVRFADLPLFVRVPSLPVDAAPGDAVMVEVQSVDLIDSDIRCIYKNPRQVALSA